MDISNSPPLDWHLNENLVTRFGFPTVASALGIIPEFVSEADPRPAWEQFNERYVDGWDPMLPGKWRLDQNNNIFYPGDPVMEPFAFARLRDETIFVYQSAWVCIVQRDGSFSVAKMD